MLLLPSLIFASIAALSVSSQAQVGVWMKSPKPGSTPSQVFVNAFATSPNGIAGWVIYVDDRVAYQVNNYSNSLAQNITLSKGTHILYTRAWDSGGAGFGTSATQIMQVGPPPWSNPRLPHPPSNATVLQNMQNTTNDWTECSTCAGGANSTTNYWTAPFQSSPSMTGSSREIFIGGPSWSNALFIKTMPGTNNASHFLWDFWVYQDSTSEANIWSSEFDLWQTLGGNEFMIGSQCDFGTGYWDTWDNANNRWITNAIPCPRWAANTWHHVQWYVERIDPTHYRYDTLVVDGHGYGLNQVWAVAYNGWSDAVGVQYQLDQDSTGTPLHEWVDNVKLTLW
jgi:Ca2+-binding RTX toxin-like protein